MCSRGLYNLCPDTKAIGYFYPGGFAEYVIVPPDAVKQNAIIKLPDNTPMIEGSLIEPLSCVINGQNYLKIEEGDTVLIYGGGPIGFMHAVMAKFSGASKVIISDPAYERLEVFGKQFEGLIEVFRLTNGYGADVVITACAARQAQMEGLEVLGSRGRISLFGGLPKDNSVISIDSNIIHYKELSVFGSFASNRRDYIRAAELISERKIATEKFISRVLPLEKINEGLEMIKQGDVLKCVVEIDK